MLPKISAVGNVGVGRFGHFDGPSGYFDGVTGPPQVHARLLLPSPQPASATKMRRIWDILVVR